MISQKRFSTIITLHIYSCYTLTPTLTITRYDLLMILLRCYSTNRNAYNSEVLTIKRILQNKAFCLYTGYVVDVNLKTYFGEKVDNTLKISYMIYLYYCHTT